MPEEASASAAQPKKLEQLDKQNTSKAGSAEQPATFADGSAEQPANQGNLLAESLASTEHPATDGDASPGGVRPASEWVTPPLRASPPASPTEPVAALPESTPAALSFYATTTARADDAVREDTLLKEIDGLVTDALKVGGNPLWCVDKAKCKVHGVHASR